LPFLPPVDDGGRRDQDVERLARAEPFRNARRRVELDREIVAGLRFTSCANARNPGSTRRRSAP
jgi:hypothetical protein